MECKICNKKFDNQFRKPIRISCEHTSCSVCLKNQKTKSNPSYKCTICQVPIKIEQFDYSILDVLDGNSELNNEIKNDFQEVEKTTKEITDTCKQKTIEIANKIDVLKSKIEDRANELINMINTRKVTLIEEADKLHADLNKKVFSND